MVSLWRQTSKQRNIHLALLKNLILKETEKISHLKIPSMDMPGIKHWLNMYVILYNNKILQKVFVVVDYKYISYK
jgi:hypothetical protein